jgi:hypothetical protein
MQVNELVHVKTVTPKVVWQSEVVKHCWHPALLQYFFPEIWVQSAFVWQTIQALEFVLQKEVVELVQSMLLVQKILE